MSDILSAVKEDRRVQYVAAVDGDRHVIKVPVEILQEHEHLQMVRAKSPTSVALLRSSIGKTGDTPIYTPCIYIEAGSPVPAYFIADGHQRVRAAKEAGIGELVVTWVSRWRSPQDALRDVMGLQYARYEMCDADIVSVLKTGLLTVKEVSDLTGKSETTVLRLEKVSKHDWLWSIIQSGAIGYSPACKLLDAADGNCDKLASLRNSLEARYRDAEKQAKHWRDQIRSQKGRKVDTKLRAKQRIKTYFEDVDWDDWEAALEDAEPVKNGSGDLVLDLSDADGSNRKSKAVWVGDSPDWQKEIAVHNFFGEKHEHIPVEDFDKVLNQWDRIREKIAAIRCQKRHAEAREAHPIPPSNPVVEVAKPDDPVEQTTDFTVGQEG